MKLRQAYRYFTLCDWCGFVRSVRALGYEGEDGRWYYRYVCNGCDR